MFRSYVFHGSTSSNSTNDFDVDDVDVDDVDVNEDGDVAKVDESCGDENPLHDPISSLLAMFIM